jgi:gamma-glutamyltranspeptidase/glutathione hydrolase
MGSNGAVGSNHPCATQAGLDTLRAGGSAADAAVAISLALGVCEPAMSGLGADGFMQFFNARTGSSTIYNGTGVAPRAAIKDKFSNGIPFNGPLSVSVPGLLGAVCAMHKAHGCLEWSALAKPAIRLARFGFGATDTYCSFANDWPGVKEALAKDPLGKKTYLGHTVGSLIVQPNLADTLEELAVDGVESFYRGKLATRLAKAMSQAGVLITEQDLAECRPEITTPIVSTYRGLEIRQTSPNSTGFTMLQILKIVERFDLRVMSEADRIHLFVEAKKLAFLDREAFGGDPRFGSPAPIQLLLSDERAAQYAERIDMKRARNVPLNAASKGGDTTYFCVVDSDGNAVGGIQSNSSAFGSAVMAGETGILLNNRLATFHLEAGHPNELAPGKRVRHTMNCPLVIKHSKLWSALGTPGADNQVQVNAQLLSFLIDFSLDPQSAVERPRWSSSQIGQGIGALESDARLLVETDFGEAVLSDLESRGHQLNRVAPLHGPCSAQIVRILDNGIRMVGSDPRRDGWAGAY